MKTLEILGVPFAQITQDEALEILQDFSRRERNHVIVTPNPEGVMQSRRNPDFAEALRFADLSLADGTGIVLASFLRARKNRLPGRVRGMDVTFALFEKLCAEGREFSAYFLGGEPGVAEGAKENMQKKFPMLKVAGVHHGFFSPEDEPRILAEINAAAPEILLVCTGMPRAEIWAARNRDVNARLTMCVGGTLDIMAGNVRPAPALMRKVGLEWLYRLISQPRRARRMLDIPRFIFAVLFSRRG